jgi:hypothetical protein
MSTPKLSRLSVDQYNAELTRLAKQMEGAVRTAGRGLGIGRGRRSTGKGLSTIRGFTKKRNGEVENLGIRFKRYLIFVEHGVGGGATSARRKKPFLSAGVDQYHGKVADTVARYYADDQVKVHDQGLREIDKRSTSIRVVKR